MPEEMDYSPHGFPKRIPEKLKAIRERLGMTPDQIAPEVGARNGAEIMAYENNEGDLPSSILWAYARLAGCAVENLMSDDLEVHFRERCAAEKAAKVETPSFECLKMRREILAKEIDYRREKRWRIFSWTSSILLAAIAGVLALTGKNFDFPMWPSRVVSAVVILIVTLYALLWISLNKKQERSLESLMEGLDSQLNIVTINSKYRFPLGYRMSLLVIAAFAISVILFVGLNRVVVLPTTSPPVPSNDKLEQQKN